MNSNTPDSAPYDSKVECELINIKQMLRDAAKKDCRNCDGSGIFYGNVCICSCVNMPVAKLGKRGPQLSLEIDDDEL